MRVMYFVFILIIITRVAFSESEEGRPHPVVEISTEYGKIDIEIFIDKARVTASNFPEYVRRDLYDHACFYRVMTMHNQPNNDIKIEVI